MAAPLGLGEFIALVQDGLQRSYDFIEDVAVANRDGGGDGVMLTVGEVTLTLPVQWSVRTREVDLRPVLTPERTITAFELVRTLLTAPMADPEFRKVLRGQAYESIARQRFAPAEPEGEEKGRAPGRAVPPLTITLPDEAKDIVKRTTKAGKLAEPEIALTVLGDGVGAARIDGHLVGRLEIRFKPVIS